LIINKKMRFNWGIGAFIFFGTFVFFMIGMVYLSTQQKSELVTEDYYEKELAFKEILKKEARTAKLSEKLSWQIINNQLSIQFPKEIGENIMGEITFFKPSNQNDDKKISFQTSSNSHSIDVSKFSSGMYKLKIDWMSNDITYYNEEVIDLPY